MATGRVVKRAAATPHVSYLPAHVLSPQSPPLTQQPKRTVAYSSTVSTLLQNAFYFHNAPPSPNFPAAFLHCLPPPLVSTPTPPSTPGF